MNNTMQAPQSKIKAFFEGFASAFNLNGDTFELPEIKTDAENILSDWQVVGNDLITVSKQLANV